MYRPVPNSENSLAQEKWHVAYHGVPVSAIRKTLDQGEILSPGTAVLHIVFSDRVDNSTCQIGCSFLKQENHNYSVAGDVLLCHAMKATPKSRVETLESKSLCLSPTLRYVGSSSFSPKHV